MTERYFNRQEAEELLPFLRRELKKAISSKQSVEQLDGQIAKAAARIMTLGGSIPPYSELVQVKAQREQTLERITKVVEEIQSSGCVVKDLDEGLVDFPSLRDGQEVFLCWKLGEERVAWWHGIEEGFAGRKPIEGATPEEPPAPRRLQ